jgi:photosystem II stability/assembly factor-like uncharacterized protein
MEPVMNSLKYLIVRFFILLLIPGSISMRVIAAENDGLSTSPSGIQQQPAIRTASVVKQMVLSATKAGNRIVTVGEHGNILLSDDEGRSFRQAKNVPTRTTLTSVSFVDAQNGWAAGQWGVILHTVDGGETWSLQRSDTGADRPLFSILFLDKEHGFAVGLWSLMLETKDGGKSWLEVTVPVPPEGGKADRNLFQIFANDGGALFIVGERGTVMSSVDKGLTWQYVNTAYKGSFWTGTALKDGTIVVAGLRGTIYRSIDNGKTWVLSKTDNKSSITWIAEIGSTIYGVGLDGITIESKDDGVTFSMVQREDRLPLTALVSNSNGKIIKMSKSGPVID